MHFETFNSLGSSHDLSRQKRQGQNQDNYLHDDIATTTSPFETESITQTQSNSYKTENSRSAIEYIRKNRRIQQESTTDWLKWSTTEIPEQFQTDALIYWTSPTTQTHFAQTKITQTQTTRVQTRRAQTKLTQLSPTRTSRTPITKSKHTTGSSTTGQKLSTAKLSFIINIKFFMQEDRFHIMRNS